MLQPAMHGYAVQQVLQIVFTVLHGLGQRGRIICRQQVGFVIQDEKPALGLIQQIDFPGQQAVHPVLEAEVRALQAIAMPVHQRQYGVRAGVIEPQMKFKLMAFAAVGQIKQAHVFRQQAMQGIEYQASQDGDALFGQGLRVAESLQGFAALQQGVLPECLRRCQRPIGVLGVFKHGMQGVTEGRALER